MINLQSSESGFVPGRHLCVSWCWRLVRWTWNCGGTAACLDYSATASSCLLRPMNVREWITYTAVTTIQHNKGSAFNTRHQNTVKCNFIYSNIQFPENKKKSWSYCNAGMRFRTCKSIIHIRPVGGDAPSVDNGSCASQWHRKEYSDCKYNTTVSIPYFFLGTQKDDAQCNLHYDLHSRSPKPASLINTKLDQHLAVKFSGNQPSVIGHHHHHQQDKHVTYTREKSASKESNHLY
jgi:hypothetical protein